MHSTIELDTKCPRCGAPMTAHSAFDDFGPASWESCSKLCYHWFDYGMENWRPEGVEDFRDLTGTLGLAAPERERLKELEECQARTGIIDPNLAQDSFEYTSLDSTHSYFGTCRECGAIVESGDYAKHYGWHRGRTVQ